MTYIGRFQKGCQIPLLFDLGELPDEAPFWSLYADADGSLAASGRLYPDFESSSTTTFRYPYFLSADVDPGTFTVVVRYSVSASPRITAGLLRVLPGGDVRGSLTSMTSYQYAETVYLMHGTDAGSIFAGRNPSF